MKFNEFGLDAGLLEGIDAIGFDTATEIQKQAIPVILTRHDLIASAQTGTGKTAAFLLPIIHLILNNPKRDSIKALVIVPTRELAVQIDQQMQGLSYFCDISSIPVYGGSDGSVFANEMNALKIGADVVICTPGRMIAHLNQNYVNLNGLNHLILDEADRMLDMGFYDDIVKIITYLPEKRQNLMFSATMPDNIRTLAKKVLYKPTEINIAMSKPAEKILQLAYCVYDTQKIPLLVSLLTSKKASRILVFCSTKSSTKDVSHELKRKGLSVADIHSDLDQKTRENVLIQFKNNKLNILVATDILSRGIDVEDISMVINFDVPNDGEDYIHRIGRTARAEADGIAITLISPKDQNRFGDIEKLLEKEVYKAKLPAILGDSPEYKPRLGASHKHGKKPFRGKGKRDKSFKPKRN